MTMISSDAVTRGGARVAPTDSAEPVQRHRTGAKARGWFGFAAHRVLDLVLVLWVAASLAFLVLHLMPGDPVDTMLRGVFQITPQMRAQVAADYGLDKPLWQQYLSYLGGLLHGDLGTSYQLRQPVTEVIAKSVVPSAQLAAAALAVGVLAGVGLAVLTAGSQRVRGFIAQTLELLSIAVPSFWLGLLLLTAFSFEIPIFPSSGEGGLAALVLPAITLALSVAGTLAQLLRSQIDAQLHRPHVLTARARGASETRVRLRHSLRHASLPALSLAGSIVASLLMGTMVVESLFGRPGIGRELLRAVNAQDAPTVMGLVVFAGAVFVVVSIVVDLLYQLADPRTRQTTGVRGRW